MMSTNPIIANTMSGEEIKARDIYLSRGNIDRLFAVLMLLQMIAAVITAFVLSPTAWSGTQSKVHIHVWSALLLGGLLASMPLLLVFRLPGSTLTRHVIAVSQMLFGALFIHLSGGRIETHFHVFVSLACLAFYNDWRVLLTAMVCTAIDHFARGFLWPQSIFGILTASPWRSVEHAGWVLLEALFLMIAIAGAMKHLTHSANREAELEKLKSNFENQVITKTSELAAACERAEKALSENLAFRYALDRYALLSIADRSGKIVEANKGFCEISGYTASELLGQDHRILNSGYHPRSFWIEMWKNISSGVPWRNEVCNKSKDGSIYWVDSSIIPQLGSDGKVERYISLRFDITEKKNAEHLVRLANQRFQELASAVNRSPDCTVVTDLDGIVRFANPAACKLDRMFGHDLQIGSKALLFTENRIDEISLHTLVATIRSGHVFDGQFELPCDSHEMPRSFGVDHTDQSKKIIQVTASPLANSEGTIDGILIAKRDVTEGVTRQRDLEEITSALDAATDCVFIVDAESLLFVYVNQGAKEHVGYSFDEMRCMTPKDINPYIAHQEFTDLLASAMATPGTAITFRTEHRHRDGHRIPVEISLQLIPNLGRVGRYLAVVRDITDQLQSEHVLQIAKEEAESSSRSKSEFLANMSHEIRTPMTAILGFADLLDTDEQYASDPALAANAVQTIRSNANHLLTIINDILDMSKIEAGKMTVEQINTSPKKLAEEVTALLQQQAFGKGISIELHFDSLIPSVIKTDPTRLRQILLNLLGNAIKFTEVGSVKLVLKYLPDTCQIQFSVIDTGIGMTEEQCTVIGKFSSFAQADGSTTRKFGGTGLGLRISNSLAQMLGGCVQVSSEPGKGSTFIVTVATGDVNPVELIDASNTPLPHQNKVVAPKIFESAEAKPQSLLGINILLAEDGPDNQRLISFHLRKVGADVTIAENGLRAFEQITATPERFHLVFMDMQMPELDGYEATRRLRDWGYKQPIIALTAHAMESDRLKCIEAGCNNYASKPIHRENLIALAIQYASECKDILEVSDDFASSGVKSRSLVT